MPYSDEHCQNPWNGDCDASDIEVYLAHEGNQIPICAECWRRIADDVCEWEV
ncbi:MAG: hypothetical protein JSV35_04015 [Candidatus Bathyarchaeota archaeon]|nr:MAG: hypothetical protein JSV35_04015 [Candidatus Bathyarchaeota archaeon]